MTVRAGIRRPALSGSPQIHAAVRKPQLTGTTTVYAGVRKPKLVGSPGTLYAGVRKPRLVGSSLSARAAVRKPRIGYPAVLVADAGPGQLVNPGVTVIVDGSASTGGGAPTWTQVSNGAPAVTIVGSGFIVGFVSPFAPAGFDVILQLSITDGTTTATDTATVSVRPQLVWVARGGAWVPHLQHHLPIVP